MKLPYIIENLLKIVPIDLGRLRLELEQDEQLQILQTKSKSKSMASMSQSLVEKPLSTEDIVVAEVDSSRYMEQILKSDQQFDAVRRGEHLRLRNEQFRELEYRQCQAKMQQESLQEKMQQEGSQILLGNPQTNLGALRLVLNKSREELKEIRALPPGMQPGLIARKMKMDQLQRAERVLFPPEDFFSLKKPGLDPLTRNDTAGRAQRATLLAGKIVRRYNALDVKQTQVVSMAIWNRVELAATHNVIDWISMMLDRPSSFEKVIKIRPNSFLDRPNSFGMMMWVRPPMNERKEF